METKSTYELGDNYSVLMDVAKALESKAESGEDCLATLCELSGEGEWVTDETGRSVYRAALEGADREGITETGVAPVENYIPRGYEIPTRVARRFGLGEKVVCKSAGYFLQGNEMIERPVYRADPENCAEPKVVATTLQEILHKEVEDEEWWRQQVYWKDLEWRHIQMVLDESGGQSERFRLLAKILDHIAEVELMEGTFVPYGNQFADSDFL